MEQKQLTELSFTELIKLQKYLYAEAMDFRDYYNQYFPKELERTPESIREMAREVEVAILIKFKGYTSK